MGPRLREEDAKILCSTFQTASRLGLVPFAQKKSFSRSDEPRFGNLHQPFLFARFGFTPFAPKRRAAGTPGPSGPMTACT